MLRFKAKVILMFNMELPKKVSKYINDNGLRYFMSKKPNVLCVSGKHKLAILDRINGFENIECWESFYNNKWTTFIKNMNAEIENTNYENTYDENDYDQHVELYEAFDYDEVSMDPDLKEYWDETYR